MNHTAKDMMRLHLGCGANVVEGWVNVDYGLGARLAKIPGFKLINKRLHILSLDWDNRIFIHDLTRQFPWNNNSASIIYSSHTFEHFSKAEGRFFLRECFRVLRGGEIIRVVVPDLSFIVQQYSEGTIRADEFLEKLGVIYGEGLTGVRKRLALFVSSPHRCMYDLPNLLSALGEAGFKAYEKAPFESGIEGIEKIEQKGRTSRAVIVEGVKP